MYLIPQEVGMDTYRVGFDFKVMGCYLFIGVKIRVTFTQLITWRDVFFFRDVFFTENMPFT